MRSALSIRFRPSLLLATFVALAVCLVSGCEPPPAPVAATPRPQVLFLCDRTPSTSHDWTFHAGCIQAVMDTMKYRKRFDAKVLVFSDKMGIAYEGAPKDWLSVSGTINEYIKNAGTLPGDTSLGRPPLQFALDQVKLNKGLPYFIAFLTDGEFSDYTASRKLMTELLKQSNVEKMVVGPTPSDPARRFQVVGNLMPKPFDEEQVIIRGHQDIEDTLRTFAKEFKKANIPEDVVN